MLLPKNKDINRLERNENKHPLLQIFFRNKNKDKLSNPKTPKTLNLPQPTNFIFHKNNNTLNIKNITPHKQLKNNINTQSHEKFKFNRLYSDVSNMSNNNNKNLFNTRNAINSINNNLIFPSLNYNANLFKLQKKGRYDQNLNEKNKENDIIYNNTNFNNNSIFISEPKDKINSIFIRFKDDKVLCQKAIELNLLIKKSSNNIHLKKNSTSIDSNITKFPHLNLDKKNDKNDKIIDLKKSNNLINNFISENHEVHKKINKRKSITLSNNFNLLKTESDINKSKEFKKRKSFLKILPKNNNNNNLTLSLQTFVPETLGLSPRARRNINIRKISSKKNKKINMDNINSITSPLNTDNLCKKSIDLKMNDNSIESSKSITNNSKKNTNNAISKFYNRYIKTYNTKSNKDIEFKNNLSNLDNSSEYFGSSEKIIILHKNKPNNYYDLNTILNRKFLDKDEDKYIAKQRMKMIEKVEKSNKSSNSFTSYNEEVKNYFLKNYVIDKITQNIFENFEPLENKVEDKKEKIQKREIYLKKIFHNILIKSHKFCFSFEKLHKLGISYLKKEKIEIVIKIRNNYILEKFDIYKKLLKQFKKKWNDQKRKEYNYKKRVEQLESRNNNTIDKYSKKNVNLFGKFDEEICIYRERIETDLNLNINRLDIVLVKENKKRENKYKSRRRMSLMKFNRKIYNSKSILEKSKILNIFEQDNNNKITEGSERLNKKISNQENKMSSNFLKIEKEFGFSNRTDSFEKFAKVYRISSFPKKITRTIIFPNNNRDLKQFNTINTEKEIVFNRLKSNLYNFNVLKNRKIFQYKNNKQINLEKRFSQIVNRRKTRIQLDKKLKIDTMTIKFAGIDQLTKEASLIKTQEMEKHLPDAKLFDKFVNILQRRKINQFDFLIQNKEEGFNRIINKQEFSTGNTLLIYATQNNLKSIVELLLLKGADPNIQNKFGNSALHIAFKNDNAFIINLLFENNADQKLKNSNGLFPWQMSKSINN